MSDFVIGTMMECGCAAAGIGKDGKPICIIHMSRAVVGAPDLTGRTARCSYGGNEVPSSTKLAFFEHRPNEPHDRYYCGCYGWD